MTRLPNNAPGSILPVGMPAGARMGAGRKIDELQRVSGELQRGLATSMNLKHQGVSQ